jgi:CelD/BcsL family acetyltransferase involved in cellulose biosynthesis
MGAPDADYHDFVGGRRRDDCAAAFVGHLRQMPGWHVCELGELRPQTLASLASPLSGATQDSAPCAALRLPASRDEFERQAGRKLRSSIRRRAGMLSEAHPDHHFMTVSRVDELPQAMEDLFRLHTARLNKKGYGGAFATESARAFHRDVAESFFCKRHAADASPDGRRPLHRRHLLLQSARRDLLLSGRLRSRFFAL